MRPAGGYDMIAAARARCVTEGQASPARGKEPKMVDVLLKRFETPDEVRVFEKGRFEIVRVGSTVLGRARYEPGWKWSVHVAPGAGTARCGVEHVGIVLSGAAAVAFEDGRIEELREGTIFHIPALPHDSWVIGDAPYVSLHLMGAVDYAK